MTKIIRFYLLYANLYVIFTFIMPRKAKKQFNARFDERVMRAIDKIAAKLDTTKTDAVKYAVLTTLENLKNQNRRFGATNADLKEQG